MASRTTSVSVDQAGGATATIVAAKAGYAIQVTSLLLSVSGAAVTVKSTFQDETANTVRFTLVGNATAPAVHSYEGGADDPAFTTALGEGLELVTGTAAAIAGFINYRYVSA